MLTTKMSTKFFSTSRSSAELVRGSLLPPKKLNPAPATYPKTLSGATQNLQLRSSAFRLSTSHSRPAIPPHRLHRARLLSAAAGAAAVSDDGLRLQDGNKVTKGGDGKMITATKKGAAVLDQHIPDHIKQAYHVLQVGDQIYDATLNQTNVGNNNNKFYIIQVLGYNADKLPLGKLSKSTILKGYDVLKKISNVISMEDRGQLEQLTGEFYTVIPHDFGFRKMSEFIIDTPQKLKAKLEMVEALGEIEIATKLLEDDSSDQDDPLYAKYKQLRCDFTPLEADSEEYSMIKTYLMNTHEKTHSGYTVDIVQIFKMSRHGETKRFQKFASRGNRMLLWHGSRLTNWAGILSQGLRTAPHEAPVNGYMFGKGVYLLICFQRVQTTAALQKHLDLESCFYVALGDMNELLNGDCNANNLPKGKLSMKRVGQMTPDLTKSRTTEDGVLVPLEKPTKHESSKTACLRYNEYIVYNEDQIKMRYALHVTFNFRRR